MFVHIVKRFSSNSAYKNSKNFLITPSFPLLIYVNRPKMRAWHSGSIPKAWGHKIKTAEPIQQKKEG